MHTQLFKGFQFRYGIFLKLLTTFMIICIPLFLISSLMFKSAVNIIRQQVLVLMEQKVDFRVSSLDAELERIFLLQERFLFDEDLQFLSMNPLTSFNYDRFKSINDLRAKLTTLATSSKYIKDVNVMMPHIKKRLSPTTGLVDLDEQEYRYFMNNKPNSSGLLADQNRLYFSTGFPHFMNNNFLLILELSIPKISADLSDAQNASFSTSYIRINDATSPFLIVASGATDEELQYIAQTAASDAPPAGNRQGYLSLDKPFSYTDWHLVSIAQEASILQPVNKFKIWLYLLYAILVVIVFLASVMLYRFIHRPFRKLIKGFKMVSMGQYGLHLHHPNKDEFHYVFQQFNQMTQQLGVLIKQVYEQTIHRQKAELKHLQSQINPHFLFNSLYILYRMAEEEDYYGVTTLSKHLGDYFKFITHTKDDFIPLAAELQHASVYTSIQELRIGKRIVFSFTEEGDLGDWVVPRLIVQPLIENAILHGLENTSKDGLVHVAVRMEQRCLCIEVADNGKGMDANALEKWSKVANGDDAESDHALWNVHRRLQLYYNKESGIRLFANAMGGLTARIIIAPKEEQPNE